MHVLKQALLTFQFKEVPNYKLKPEGDEPELHCYPLEFLLQLPLPGSNTGSRVIKHVDGLKFKMVTSWKPQAIY